MFNKRMQTAIATALLTIFVAGPLVSGSKAEAADQTRRNRWEEHKKRQGKMGKVRRKSGNFTTFASYALQSQALVIQ